MSKIILAIFIIYGQISFAFDISSIPNPTNNGSYISNPDEILSRSTVANLTRTTKSLEQNTSVELAVVIIQSIENAVPKQIATELFNTWGIGKKGKDNGVLIFLVMDQKRIEIEVGYGLEGILTDVRAGRIIDSYMISSMRNSGPDASVLAGVTQVINLLSNPKGSQKDEKMDMAIKQVNITTPESMHMLRYLPLVMFIFIIFFVGMVAKVMLNVSKSINMNLSKYESLSKQSFKTEEMNPPKDLEDFVFQTTGFTSSKSIKIRAKQNTFRMTNFDSYQEHILKFINIFQIILFVGFIIKYAFFRFSFLTVPIGIYLIVSLAFNYAYLYKKHRPQVFRYIFGKDKKLKIAF